ncbi:unnamed protein product [Moneuplotes crassus]|uniref:Uncharacterized protein n=1 Tax=Euplotes crassus TaxID=5936 RepID=A0AAD2D285_EUPCR|nr:unnamed protein product [Moneuplotes crassus]
MGCGSSTGADSKICLRKTKLFAVDEFFGEVQGLCEELYTIQDLIKSAEDKLLYDTDFHHADGANAKHAIAGIVFRVASLGNLDNFDKFVNITDKQPFISLEASSAPSETISSINAANDYINSVFLAKDRIEPLADKAKTFIEKAPEIPSKAKDEIAKAKDLDILEKVKSLKNTKCNVKEIARLPTVLFNFKDCVMKAITNIQSSIKELNSKKSKLNSISMICKNKRLTTPMTCYQECGDPISKTEKKPASKSKKKLMKKTKYI